MSNKNLQEMLTSRDKNISQATNAIARLWRTVLYENDIQHGNFDNAITRYLEKLEYSSDQSKKEQSREKGNLVKELSNPSMTWRNFVKGMQVLNPLSVTLNLDIQWRRGKTTTHSVKIDLIDDDTV